jgi:hypothetical protein
MNGPVRNQGLTRMLKSCRIKIAFDWVEEHGYDMQHRLEPYQRASKEAFFAAERDAKLRYAALPEDVKMALPDRLEAKYRTTPVLGTVMVSDAIAELATIVDPLDPFLGCMSQLTHQLQLAEQMEKDGVDEEFLTCGLIHDLGKLLIKFGDEDPINVEAGGKKVPLRGKPGDGLLNCTFRWDHGDFAYMRLKDYAPPEVAWLLRHHSIDIEACEQYMNDDDRELTRRRLIPFMKYDDHKDMYAVPQKSFDRYRPLIDRMFPAPIMI